MCTKNKFLLFLFSKRNKNETTVRVGIYRRTRCYPIFYYFCVYLKKAFLC